MLLALDSIDEPVSNPAVCMCLDDRPSSELLWGFSGAIVGSVSDYECPLKAYHHRPWGPREVVIGRHQRQLLGPTGSNQGRDRRHTAGSPELMGSRQQTVTLLMMVSWMGNRSTNIIYIGHVVCHPLQCSYRPNDHKQMLDDQIT